MVFADTARLMAEAVLAGDLFAARQLADWLVDHVVRPQPPAVPCPAGRIPFREWGLRGYTRECALRALVRLGKSRRPHRPVFAHRVSRDATLADLAACPVSAFEGSVTLARIRLLLARHGLHLTGDVPLTGEGHDATD